METTNLHGALSIYPSLDVYPKRGGCSFLLTMPMQWHLQRPSHAVNHKSHAVVDAPVFACNEAHIAALESCSFEQCYLIYKVAHIFENGTKEWVRSFVRSFVRPS